MMMMGPNLARQPAAEPWRWRAWAGEEPVLPKVPEPRKRPGPARGSLGAIFETLRGSRGPKEAYSDIAVGLGRKYYSIKRMIVRERSRWRRERGGILGK
jgi:hypothetical protein